MVVLAITREVIFCSKKGNFGRKIIKKKIRYVFKRGIQHVHN
jgi:hypothetical protein